jgi:hypothetical protein
MQSFVGTSFLCVWVQCTEPVCRAPRAHRSMPNSWQALPCCGVCRCCSQASCTHANKVECTLVWTFHTSRVLAAQGQNHTPFIKQQTPESTARLPFSLPTNKPAQQRFQQLLSANSRAAALVQPHVLWRYAAAFNSAHLALPARAA